MPATELAPRPAPPRPPDQAGRRFRQFPVAWRFALRDQARNRLAWLLLIGFVPAWYELMLGIAGHTRLTFRLYATGRGLTVDGGHLTLITAGLNSVTMIAGFAVFAAIRRTLAFDQRLVFAGYRQAMKARSSADSARRTFTSLGGASAGSPAGPRTTNIG